DFEMGSLLDVIYPLRYQRAHVVPRDLAQRTVPVPRIIARISEPVLSRTLTNEIGIRLRDSGWRREAWRHCHVPHGLTAEERQQVLSFRPTQTLRSEEHTSELQSRSDLVCRLLLE